MIREMKTQEKEEEEVALNEGNFFWKAYKKANVALKFRLLCEQQNESVKVLSAYRYFQHVFVKTKC